MKKLKKLEHDIFDLLRQKEPSMLRWSEVVNALWPSYKDKYRKGGRKSFGVVVSNKFKELEGKLVKKEGEYWGTFASSPQEAQNVSYWDRLKKGFAEKGGTLIKTRMQKGLPVGRDRETGHRVYNHDTDTLVQGIIVLKGALELVALARSLGTHIGDQYDGIFLTTSPIGFKDHLMWKDKIYEVSDVEERLEGYDSSHRVAYLRLASPEKLDAESACEYFAGEFSDGRSQTKAFLETFLDAANIVKDDGTTKASYVAIYADPNYDIMKEELQASKDAVDGLYAIGESETIPERSADQEVRRYEENVPITIFTINKPGVKGIILRRIMATELMRICDAHPDCMHRTLRRIRNNDRLCGCIMLYSTKFVLNYRQPAPQSGGRS